MGGTSCKQTNKRCSSGGDYAYARCEVASSRQIICGTTYICRCEFARPYTFTVPSVPDHTLFEIAHGQGQAKLQFAAWYLNMVGHGVPALLTLHSTVLPIFYRHPTKR